MLTLGIVVFLLFLGLFLAALWSMRRTDRALQIPGEVPVEIKRRFLLDTPDRLKLICPSEFLAEHERDKWKAIVVFTGVGLGLLLAIVLLNQLQVVGLPLHDVLWILALLGEGIHIGWRVFKRSKTYAVKLDLGDDLLVTQEMRWSRQYMGYAFLALGAALLIVNPLAVITDFHHFMCLISMVELATVFFLARDRVILTEEGIYFSHCRVAWEKIAWYRWYDHKAGVLVGVDQISLRVTIYLLPVAPENESEVADILQRFRSDKELDVIDTISSPGFHSTKSSDLALSCGSFDDG